MSTIVTIQSTDVIANSRADINTNFSNLNTDKIETSYLDTDTALTANSDVKIASQKAVKAYVDGVGTATATTTVKGTVEIATQAEVDAGTATGGTGASLVVTPATVNISVLSVRNQSTGAANSAGSGNALVTNTIMRVGRMVIPYTIRSCTKFTFEVASVSVSGTLKIALYSEDGQTKIFDFTTATISVGGNVSTTISAVTIPAGVYYIAALPVSTANITPRVLFSSSVIGDVSGEPVYDGKVTVTADTIPSTITPTALTYEANNTLHFQLDK